MSKTLFVFENIDTTPRRKLFSVQGVPVMATPRAWLSLPLFCVLGIVVALAQRSESVMIERLLNGVGYGLLLYLANVFHSVGHILSAKLVGTPMEVLLLTATRDVTLYRKAETSLPKRVFVGRSVGGPAANIVVGFLALSLWHLFKADWLWICSVFNFVIGGWTLCPVPSMDGWVIWGELFGFRRRPNKSC